jgi:hypothetical protein
MDSTQAWAAIPEPNLNDGAEQLGQATDAEDLSAVGDAAVALDHAVAGITLPLLADG